MHGMSWHVGLEEDVLNAHNNSNQVGTSQDNRGRKGTIRYN